MFVSIINKDEGAQGLYECQFVRIKQDEDPNSVFICMDDKPITHKIDKRTHRVFLLNNEGKTIDKYEW